MRTEITREVWINNLLHENEPHKLHEMMDIPLDFCIDVCQRFRLAGKISLNRQRSRPEFLKEIREAWDAARLTYINEVEEQISRHD